MSGRGKRAASEPSCAAAKGLCSPTGQPPRPLPAPSPLRPHRASLRRRSSSTYTQRQLRLLLGRHSKRSRMFRALDPTYRCQHAEACGLRDRTPDPSRRRDEPGNLKVESRCSSGRQRRQDNHSPTRFLDGTITAPPRAVAGREIAETVRMDNSPALTKAGAARSGRAARRHRSRMTRYRRPL